MNQAGLVLYTIRVLNNAPINGHPLGGGTPGKYNFHWGLIGRFEQSFHPAGGGNEGALVSVSLAPQGKQVTLQVK